jgi:NAD(P)-dependent dehydrogenase (short-subunit alcohol dehydrogenase family)
MKTESIDYYKNENPEYYKDKGVIVTGATGGIGSLLTSTLIELGAKVVAVVKDENKLKEMFDSQIKNGSLQYHITDFSTEIYYNTAFSNIMMKLEGKLDIMFLCHGKYCQGDIMETNLKEYGEIININTRSFMAMISLAIPFLKYTKGNIVALSSLESYIPVKSSFLMTTTKCMVNMLIKDTALEVASFGVRVNGVAPGVTNTNFRLEEFEDNKEENNKKYLEFQGNKNLLSKSVIEPDEVVDTMLFLGCDDAGFITGEIIKIDSGFSLNHCNKYSEQ